MSKPRKRPPQTAQSRRQMASIPSIVELIECPQRREPTPPGPCAMVVFGASGDLTSRLLVPALYNLSRTRLIPEHFALIGVARSDATSESWRDYLYEKLKSYAGKTAGFNGGRIDEEAWSRLADKMSYVQGDLSRPELYDNLRAALAEADKNSRHAGQRHLLPCRRRTVLLSGHRASA